ncbi:hypothetical protein ALI22I_01360 [Saccharothrix sp. ALI-22-I]|nr:hypothetical protein ALI22I_01360 [Saccharothrix sp. ALI-22-I]
MRRLAVAGLLATTAGAGVMADVDGVPNLWQASWLTCAFVAAGMAGWLTCDQKNSEPQRLSADTWRNCAQMRAQLYRM